MKIVGFPIKSKEAKQTKKAELLEENKNEKNSGKNYCVNFDFGLFEF